MSAYLGSASGARTGGLADAAPGGKAPDDTISLKVNQTTFSGWQSVRVTRGIERMPSEFQIEVTETYPGQGTAAVAKPGDACEVYLGADKVLTGYVDRYMPRLSPREHVVLLVGRSRCTDLVDCAARLEKASLNSTSIVNVANALVAPFGSATGAGYPSAPIKVVALAGDGAGIFFTMNVNMGETPYEILETLARYEGMLVYDDTDGNLVLARVGTAAMASGLQEGVNLQSCHATFSQDERFSEYNALVMSVARWQEAGNDGNRLATITDPEVLRYRPRVIVSEQSQNGEPLAKLRAVWERNRRRGRSQAALITVDSWRDSAGRLWEPNMLVPVHVPACKIVNQQWIIAEVTYDRRIDSGTIAYLTVMPPEAFSPEPVELNLMALALAKDMNEAPPEARQSPRTSE